MRLINVKTLELETVTSEKHSYAILSHTWSQGSEGEISMQEFQGHTSREELKKHAGFQKVKRACEKAAAHNLDYLWADTCCIDQSSSAELSKSINSMFRWYKESAECLVYLSDVSASSDDWEDQFRQSRWFKRGWTLQELIAPSLVTFYDHKWKKLDTRHNMRAMIHDITQIPQEILVRGPEELDQFCIAQKMSWASMRMTSEPEDIAYCLLGLFDINLSPIYGEGAEKAFIRLQEEILRHSDDHSIFAWCVSTEEAKTLQFSGLLANSPQAFSLSGEIIPGSFSFTDESLRVSISQGGLDLSVCLARYNDHGLHKAWLNCLSYRNGESGGKRVAVFLQQISSSRFCRVYADRLKELRSSDGDVIIRKIYVKHKHTWPRPVVGFCLRLESEHLTTDHPKGPNGAGVTLESKLPEDKFLGSDPRQIMYWNVKDSMPSISPSEVMADVSMIRPLPYGVVTYAIRSRADRGPGPTEKHIFQIMFGYETLWNKEHTLAQPLFPWYAVTGHPSLSSADSFDSNDEKYEVWQKSIEPFITTKCPSAYDIPSSSYSYNESQVRKLFLSMENESLRGIIFHVIRIRCSGVGAN